MKALNIARSLVLAACGLGLVVGCTVTADDDSGGKSKPSCDAATQGFVTCGPAYMDITCQPGTYCSDPTFATCSDGCASSANCGCNESCVGGSCTASSVCGDGQCNGGETPATCPADCGSGSCGNGICDGGESAQSCPADCGSGSCGNGVCDSGESAQSCPADCASHLPECLQLCNDYNFFECFEPGGLQSCYDLCNAASEADRAQFGSCAATGAVFCELECLEFL